MCGIAGSLNFSGKDPDASAVVSRLCESQAHRGPDDHGLLESNDGRLVLGHRRLSIIDLSTTASQPMQTSDGRFKLVFNGEIYNYQQLRSELETEGVTFRTQGDTEVVLQAYIRWNTAALDRLNGMFAFAVYDERTQELLLARDPLGIKPAYWTSTGKSLLFASELQALRKELPQVSNDMSAVGEFLRWGSIGAPRTLYREIQALEPGQYMVVRADGRKELTNYFQLSSLLGRTQQMTQTEAQEHVQAAVRNSVKRHQVADVEVGVFLSGGVDSVTMASTMSSVGAQIRSINLALNQSDEDESKIAQRVAADFSLTHREVAVDIDQISESLIDGIDALDQPSIDGINTYFVSRAAAQLGLKVVVSGIGGDELFGGYSSFRRLPRMQARLSKLSAIPGLRATASGLLRMAPRRFEPHRRSKAQTIVDHAATAPGAYFALRSVFSDSQVEALIGPHESLSPTEQIEQRLGTMDLPAEECVSFFEIGQYLRCQLLRDTDAMSMRHSLEVRTPLVDRKLYEEIFTVPASLRQSGPAKALLRNAPKRPVPSYVWDRKKQGFYFPINEWLKKHGSLGRAPEGSNLRPEATKQAQEDFQKGRLHWSRYWALLVLQRYLA